MTADCNSETCAGAFSNLIPYPSSTLLVTRRVDVCCVACVIHHESPFSFSVGEVLRSGAGADEEHKADVDGDVEDVSGVKNLFRMHEKEEKKAVAWPFSAPSSSRYAEVNWWSISSMPVS